LERVSKEAVAAQNAVLPQYFPEGTGENYENLQHRNTKHEAAVLLTCPRRSEVQF
jgi:hypothetical protein